MKNIPPIHLSLLKVVETPWAKIFCALWILGCVGFILIISILPDGMFRVWLELLTIAAQIPWGIYIISRWHSLRREIRRLETKIIVCETLLEFEKLKTKP